METEGVRMKPSDEILDEAYTIFEDQTPSVR